MQLLDFFVILIDVGKGRMFECSWAVAIRWGLVVGHFQKEQGALYYKKVVLSRVAQEEGFMYILEGNIGAGKSTLLQLLREHMPQVVVAQEPLNDWDRPLGGPSLLANFYQDPVRWAYSMETFTMLSRIREHIYKKDSALCLILERSVYSGYYCFARNSFQNGFMTAAEWAMCTEWFNFLVPRLCQIPHGFIYLRVSSSVALERVKKRERSAESSLSVEYLEQIHDYHERFLIARENLLPELKAVPVLVISTDGDFEVDRDERDRILGLIRSFLAQTSPPPLVSGHEYLSL